MLPERKHIQVLADDTDIFVLLVYFVWLYKPAAQVLMRKYNGKVIDINATVYKLGDKSCDLLALHALSGCDSVSFPYGKGKISAISLMNKMNLHLKVFADENSKGTWKQGCVSFPFLYCGEAVESLSDLRCTLFMRKKDPPGIKKSLPPTKECAAEHIKRARLQVLLWRAADKTGPSWMHNQPVCVWVEIRGRYPCPCIWLCRADIADKAVLELVACGCKSTPPCSRATCSCRSGGLPCTTYCCCKGGEQCADDNLKETSAVENYEETDDEEEYSE